LDKTLVEAIKTDRDSLARFIADVVVQILDYVIEHDRDERRRRAAKGLHIAKQKGIHVGRKAIIRPDDYHTVVALWKNGEISHAEAAKRLNISRPTLFRWCRMDAEQQQHASAGGSNV